MMNSFRFFLLASITSFLFSCSNVESVTIVSPPESVVKGSTIQLKGLVKGSGSPDTTLNWTIVEPVSKGTSISNDGMLTISNDEIAKSLTIKAVSTDDDSKVDTSSVKVLLDPKLFYGDWVTKRDNKIQKVTLESSKYTCLYPNDGFGYKLQNLEWTPITNTDPGTSKSFPEGYIIVGKATGVYRISNINNGQIITFYLFLNKDKSAYLRKDPSDPSNVYLYDRVK
ncbi:hypothetical protein SKC37_00865 [Aquirufa sp. HETE-83D]|uniref:BIG2 domain-containing protein n=1 Tax=Aquirufa esocilacus TaxID=3096513 RepID=A0ABW6DFA4_9BACT